MFPVLHIFIKLLVYLSAMYGWRSCLTHSPIQYTNQITESQPNEECRTAQPYPVVFDY